MMRAGRASDAVEARATNTNATNTGLSIIGLRLFNLPCLQKPITVRQKLDGASSDAPVELHRTLQHPELTAPKRTAPARGLERAGAVLSGRGPGAALVNYQTTLISCGLANFDHPAGLERHHFRKGFGDWLFAACPKPLIGFRWSDVSA